MVHFKMEYGDISAAMEHTDGLAVVSVLFRVSTGYNAALDPLVAALKEVKNEGECSKI